MPARSALCVLLVLLLPALGRAQASDLAPGPEATVAAVVDGDTVVLDDGGEVRLVGL